MKLAMLLAAFVCLSRFAPALSAAESLAADAKLDAFFKKYLEETFRHAADGCHAAGRPSLRRPAGRSLGGGPERWRRARPADAGRSCRSEVDYSQLSAAAKIDFEILRHELHQRSVAGREHAALRGRPAGLQRVHQRQRVPAADPIDAAEGEEHRQRHRAHGADPAGRGRRPREPAQSAPVATETAIRQNRGAIAFYEQELFELAGETPQRDALKAAAAPVVACLQEYQQFLEKDLLPRAHGDVAAGPGKVRPEAGIGTRRRPDGRPGAGRRRGRIRAA